MNWYKFYLHVQNKSHINLYMYKYNSNFQKVLHMETNLCHSHMYKKMFIHEFIVVMGISNYILQNLDYAVANMAL
jgi:hypothetical protein